MPGGKLGVGVCERTYPHSGMEKAKELLPACSMLMRCTCKACSAGAGGV